MQFLVGYNGSEEARAALFLAATYAENLNARVVVVTSMGGGRGERPEKITKAARGLAFAEKYLKEKGIVCESHQLARGMLPGEDLVRYADENQIDQIFIGVEKVSRTHKIIVGSTAQYIILKASCPVVSVNNSSKFRSLFSE